MTSQDLFVELLHRLQRYDDAVVLHALISQHADVTEFKTSCSRIALNLLGARVTAKQVERSISRLTDLGLLEQRIHPNYRTLLAVDRQAVRNLLSAPVAHCLPGLQEVSFPFLDHLNAEAEARAEKAADAVIKRMGDDQVNPDRDGSAG